MAQRPKQLPKLIVRQAALADIAGIRDLMAKAYPAFGPTGVYSEAQLRGQMHQFPEGQFVATYEGHIIGYCATFRIPKSLALASHDWATITGRGYASRHDPQGDWMYGMDVCVDPDFRGRRIGQRLYNERRRLCQDLRLKGIVFAGRMPNLARRWKAVGSAENYLKLVLEGKQRDPVIGFQLRNGFEPVGILHDYLPIDHESRGFATHMIWRNPQVPSGETTEPARVMRRPQTVRVAAVQYQLRAVSSFEEFAHQVEYFVDVVADYKADFAVFPELFTLQLLSIENRKIPAADAIAALTNYTGRFKEMMSSLAVSYNVNIIGGSHPTREADGEVYNISYVFLRDGSVHEQRQSASDAERTLLVEHQGRRPGPRHRYRLRAGGGGDLLRLRIPRTDPPSSSIRAPRSCSCRSAPTSGRAYMRVRYCAAARAVENQCYVVMAGNVGNLPKVENMDIQYSQSCVLTPCDFPFARDGVAAEAAPNVEMVAIADLHLDSLYAARQGGAVLNLKDRRFDLYSVVWRGH